MFPVFSGSVCFLCISVTANLFLQPHLPSVFGLNNTRITVDNVASLVTVIYCTQVRKQSSNETVEYSEQWLKPRRSSLFGGQITLKKEKSESWSCDGRKNPLRYKHTHWRWCYVTETRVKTSWRKLLTGRRPLWVSVGLDTRMMKMKSPAASQYLHTFPSIFFHLSEVRLRWQQIYPDGKWMDGQ